MNDLPFDDIAFQKSVQYYTDVIFYNLSTHKTYNLIDDNTITADEINTGPEGNTQVTTASVIERAENSLKDNKVLRFICPALQSTTKDIREISKIILGVLLPLSLSKKIDLEVDPLLYAGIIVMIYNAGVTTLCKNIKDE